MVFTLMLTTCKNTVIMVCDGYHCDGWEDTMWGLYDRISHGFVHGRVFRTRKLAVEFRITHHDTTSEIMRIPMSDAIVCLRMDAYSRHHG
jgi:hypothetical protein